MICKIEGFQEKHKITYMNMYIHFIGEGMRQFLGTIIISLLNKIVYLKDKHWEILIH